METAELIILLVLVAAMAVISLWNLRKHEEILLKKEEELLKQKDEWLREKEVLLREKEVLLRQMEAEWQKPVGTLTEQQRQNNGGYGH